jgi:hypothetical protein
MRRNNLLDQIRKEEPREPPGFFYALRRWAKEFGCDKRHLKRGRIFAIIFTNG